LGPRGGPGGAPPPPALPASRSPPAPPATRRRPPGAPQRLSAARRAYSSQAARAFRLPPAAQARREGGRLLPGRPTLAAPAASVAHEAVAEAQPPGGAGTPPAPGQQGPTFQEAIQRLQDYWSRQGCAVWLPHNTEVGAGTMNPATFLRVLGSEPWSVAYAEPSVRPDDSRYGDNPNRVQRHTQYQVILKPDPGNAQELFLGSLEALGIDTRKHDVRFVEDNWESPALGAWGLGWEVWLDGMEVTQFTYFQQAGGLVLPVPAVEITYGLERIVMALQGVSHFRDIRYNDAVRYGEMFLQNEYEMSVFNLDEADVEDQRQRFQLFEREARRLIEKRLPIPAFDHLLKCSHAFNVMDARGAVGVTERAACFGALRFLSREVAKLWVERREELDFPLGTVAPAEAPAPGAVEGAPAEAADFVFELGTEELPPDEVDSVVSQVAAALGKVLGEARLAHASVEVDGTPRRVVALVKGLAARQEDLTERVRGPPVKVAVDGDGQFTKAALGFCKKNGLAESDLEVEGDYVWATVESKGAAAAEVLGAALPGLISGIGLRKSMRWDSPAAFSRPVRWIVALHGGCVVPFTWGTVASGRSTRLLRNSDSPEAELASAGDYEGAMAAAGIDIRVASRRDAIWASALEAARSVGGTVPERHRGGLLEEVSNLVEAPTIVMGAFDGDFLSLPDDVLVMVMRKHQRYFPVYRGDELLPHFITVANGPIDVDAVRAGNEAVLRARFADAKFFYEEDKETTLAEKRPKLAGTLFQKDLGTLLDKSDRCVALVDGLAAATGLAEAAGVAREAATLARADLATGMVMEMTALAGTMGRHYAQCEGLDEAVSEAIFESVLPRSADDELPRTPAGILVSVADKADSLVGLFAAKCAPTASADPYGLRRAALGMLLALVESGTQASVSEVLRLAAAEQPLEVSSDVLAEVEAFVGKRLEQMLVDRGLSVDAVRAALAEVGDNPARAAGAAAALDAELARGGAGTGEVLGRAMEALARPTRLTRGKELGEGVQVDESLFEQDEERDLYAALAEVRGRVGADMAVPAFLAEAAKLQGPVGAFMDGVFVMAEDDRVRANRLALLRDVAQLSRGIVDLSLLPGF